MEPRELGQLARHRRIVDDPRGLDAERLHRLNVRLVSRASSPEMSRDGTPLATARSASTARRGTSACVDGDDQFPGHEVGDAVRQRELDHRAVAGRAHPRLQRAGRVVGAGMDDSRVVAGLVRRPGVLLLEQGDGQPAAVSRSATARPRMPPPMIVTEDAGILVS